MELIKTQYNQLYLGTKLLIVLSVIVNLIGFNINQSIYQLLSDVPLDVIKYKQLWRLLIPQFVCDNWQNTVISILCLFIIRKCEKERGTIRFLFDIFFKNILIQIIFLLLTYVLSYIQPNMLEVNSFGFWDITLLYLITNSIKEPQYKYFKYVKADYAPSLFFILMNCAIFPRIDLIALTLYAMIDNSIKGNTKWVCELLYKELAKAFEIKLLCQKITQRNDFASLQINQTKPPEIELN